MIEITELAAEKLAAYLRENNIDSPVRIAVMNGCGGPSLGLALDGKKDTDHTHENETFTLLLDQDLAQSCGRVTVDYLEKSSGCGCGDRGGFSITSDNPLPGSAGGCGGSCSGSGCC
ncbi:IscA/HesB family protein [Desulfolithobacter sp.]